MAKSLAKKKSSAFVERLSRAIEYHRELLLAVSGKTRQAALETMLAEQFTFNVVVLWEVFLSDLLLAYLVASPGNYSKGLKDRVAQSLKEKFGASVESMISLDFPRELSLPKARSLVDRRQFNITIQSADQLSSRANALLTAKYARRFTLDPEDAQFFDFTVAVRNYLAHRSDAARNKLTESVSALTGKNLPFKASTSRLGTYLKAPQANGDTRAILIAQGLIALAGVLA